MYMGKNMSREMFFNKATPFSLACGSIPVHIRSGIGCVVFTPDQIEKAVMFKEVGLVLSIEAVTEEEDKDSKRWKEAQENMKKMEGAMKTSAKEAKVDQKLLDQYNKFMNVAFKYFLNETHELHYITHDIYRGYEFAVCEYHGEIVYVFSNFINFDPVLDRSIPTKLAELNGDKIFDEYNNVHIYDDDDKHMVPAYTYQGEIWRCVNRDDGAYVMNIRQVMINAKEKWYNHVITEIPEEKKRIGIIKYGQLVSVVLDSKGEPVIERVYGDANGGYNYALCIYNHRLGYIYVGSFHRYLNNVDGFTEGRMAETNYILENGALMESQTDALTTVTNGTGYNSEAVINFNNIAELNKNTAQYSVEYSDGVSFNIMGRELVSGNWFYVALYDNIDREHKTLYIPVVDFGDDPLKLATARRERRKKDNRSSNYVYVDDSWKEKIKASDYPAHVSGDYYEADSSIAHNGESDYYENGNGDGTYSSGSRNSLRWYHRELEGAYYENPEVDGASELGKYQDRRLPNEDAGEWELLSQAGQYDLHFDKNVYLVDGQMDDRQIRKINRFQIADVNNSGLATKSFVFMTRPDLNLYKLDANNNVINGQMHPNLKRISEFRYIGRMKELGSAILDSLEYWGTAYKTPWLSIISNQAMGYRPKDREIGTTEIGETFHGHKVLYGKHDFKHQIADTITIPFTDRRDLSLYYTLKIWTEYIHCLNLGLHEPHPVHVKNGELDYAVSLYFISTNETMEEIVYWEKLTGVFPLSCPDSIFEWSSGNNDRDLKYEIPFAYSMRSVMKIQDLFELDRLYQKGVETTVPLEIPYDPEYSLDARNAGVIANMVAYYMDGKTQKEKDEFASQLMKNGTDLSSEFNLAKYYYESYKDEYDHEGKFLSNWCSNINMHGIPYVKGPFIMPAYDWNGGKFLLKWV